MIKVYMFRFGRGICGKGNYGKKEVLVYINGLRLREERLKEFVSVGINLFGRF